MIARAPARERMWFDGALANADEIAVRPFTHALHYGSGVFEGIRAYEARRGTAVFRLRDHLQALFHVGCGVRTEHSTTTKQRSRARSLRRCTQTRLPPGYIRPLAYFGEKGHLARAGVPLPDARAHRAQAACRVAARRDRGRARHDVELAKDAVALDALDRESQRPLHEFDSCAARCATPRF